MRLVATRLGSGSTTAELRCGLNEHPSGVAQSRFVTPQLACVWIQHGTGTLRREGPPHPLIPGDAFLRLPGEAHDVIMPGPAAWLFIAVPAAADALLSRVCARARALPVLRAGLDPRLAARWRACAQRLATCADEDLGVVASELLGLIAELHRRAARAVVDPWAERACQALERDLRAPVPVVAAALGCKPSAFRARFHAAIGLSPQAWRIRRRIAQAQDLLANPAATLDAVAEQLGYPDLPTFAKQFRAVTGQPPGTWRAGL